MSENKDPNAITGDDWNREMGRLQTHFGRRMEPKQSESWYHYLKGHTRDALHEAVDELNVSKRAFPSFGELIDTVKRFEKPWRSEKPRETLETAIHPNQLPLARFCLALLECDTRESIQAALNTACESRHDLSDIYVRMSKARFETLPQLTEGEA